MFKKLTTRFTIILLLNFIAFLNIPSTAVHAAQLPNTEFGAGDTVTIVGNGFGNGGSICFENDNQCLNYPTNIQSWNNEIITFTMGSYSTISPWANLYVYNTHGGVSNMMTYKLIPNISNIEMQQNQLTIIGNYFGYSAKGSFHETKIALVKENKEYPLTLVSWSNDKIVVLIPNNIPDGNYFVILNNGIVKKDILSKEINITAPVSNDPLSAYQLYLKSSNISKMWSLGQAQSTVTVAVIDDGVYLNHTDLQGRFWKNTKEIIGDKVDNEHNGYIDDIYGWNFIKNNGNIDLGTQTHGTSVAGIIAANTNNTQGIAGISSKSQIMPLVACDENGCTTEAVTNAIRYAVDNGANVINMSLSTSLFTGFTQDYNSAIEYANEHHVSIVAAAGNGDSQKKGINTDTYLISPVCNESKNNVIIGVGALDKTSSQLMPWSNHGKCVDIYAQGEFVLTTAIKQEFGNYDIPNGTSFAAPIVTGVIAHILSIYPTLTPEEIYDYLTGNSSNGILDAEATLKHIQATYIPKEKTVYSILPSSITSDEIFEKNIAQSPYKKAISSLKEIGVIKGYPDGTFQPKNTINRAEFITIIIRALGISSTGQDCFSDVKQEWFAKDICSAKSKGVIGGYPDGSFKPDINVNTVEALKIVIEAFVTNKNKLVDGNNWYDKYVDFAKKNNLFLTGFDDLSHNLTREEMAEIIYRLFQSKQ